jgi:hypothetical protein
MRCALSAVHRAQRNPMCSIDDEPPQRWYDCRECGGEGAIEKWESVSRWSLDPPSALVIPCHVCNGAGGLVDDETPDRPEGPCPPIQMQEGECPF